MAYTIVKSDGTVLTTIADGTIQTLVPYAYAQLTEQLLQVIGLH